MRFNLRFFCADQKSGKFARLAIGEAEVGFFGAGVEIGVFFGFFNGKLGDGDRSVEKKVFEAGFFVGRVHNGAIVFV